MSKSVEDTCLSQISDLISKNTSCLLRAVHHMELYFCRYSDFKQHEETICVNDTIRRITAIANDYCSLHGFRINASSAARVDVFTNTYNHAFCSVFISLLTIALRLSETKIVTVDMHEKDGKATISIITNALSQDFSQFFESEYSFIEDIASICGWEISRYRENMAEAYSVKSTFTFDICDVDGASILRANGKELQALEEYIKAELSILEFIK